MRQDFTHTDCELGIRAGFSLHAADNNRDRALNGLREWQNEIALRQMALFTHLFHNSKAVDIVSLEVTGSHVSEDRHDIVQDRVGNQASKTTYEK